MPNVIKKRIVAELADTLHELRHAVLVDFTRLTAGQENDLRGKAEEQSARVLVVKNSLARSALRQAGLAGVAELIDGPTALIYGGDDPVVLTKAVLDWSRKEKVLSMRGGVVAGQALGVDEMKALAALPPLLVLHAQVVGAIAAPLTGFIGVLQGVLRSFVGALKAIADKDAASN